MFLNQTGEQCDWRLVSAGKRATGSLRSKTAAGNSGPSRPPEESELHSQSVEKPLEDYGPGRV